MSNLCETGTIFELGEKEHFNPPPLLIPNLLMLFITNNSMVISSSINLNKDGIIGKIQLHLNQGFFETE